jgi:ABC-type molybdate transport system substrate-binding protein
MITSPRRLAHLAVLLATLMGLSVSACGSDSTANSTTSAAAQLREVIVSAATSLKKALTGYGDQFHGGIVRLSFVGSAELAAPIRQGIKPDVFAAANTKLPDQLFKQGLVEKPVSFATKTSSSLPSPPTATQGLLARGPHRQRRDDCRRRGGRPGRRLHAQGS